MSWFYRKVVRPVLFANDAEQIHERTLHGLAWASRHPRLCGAVESFLAAPALPVELFGLRFPNPVGLAAGMDKNAEAVPAWAALGFGFSELGGVTWHPQPGNQLPRVFRAISEAAIVNRMGFNNEGATALALKLNEWRQSGRWPAHPVGINLGKSKITPLDKAAEDYARLLEVHREHLEDFPDEHGLLEAALGARYLTAGQHAAGVRCFRAALRTAASASTVPTPENSQAPPGFAGLERD